MKRTPTDTEPAPDATTDDAEPAAVIDCPVCGGPAPYLGRLGRLAWYRCRDCGMESNVAIDAGGADD